MLGNTTWEQSPSNSIAINPLSPNTNIQGFHTHIHTIFHIILLLLVRRIWCTFPCSHDLHFWLSGGVKWEIKFTTHTCVSGHRIQFRRTSRLHCCPLSGHPTTVCLELFIAWGQLYSCRWPFHSCARFSWGARLWKIKCAVLFFSCKFEKVQVSQERPHRYKF